MAATVKAIKPATRQQPVRVRSKREKRGHRQCVKVSAKAKNPHENGQKGSLSAVPKLLLAGAIVGPLLDCIHTNVGLLEYDLAPLRIGALKSSATVPALLASYYAVLGTLHLQAPRLLRKLDTSHAKPSDAATVVGSLLTLASMLEVSSLLFVNNAGLYSTYAVLSFLCLANWYTFDRRSWTLVLGFLVAVLAPISEVVLMKMFGVWHYPRGDIFIAGEPFPSWVFFCYFFYTPFVTHLSSYVAGQEVRKKSN